MQTYSSTRTEEPVDTALSVGQYIRTLNAALKPVTAVVQGEISECAIRGRACYFKLVDKDGSAVLPCIIWTSKLYGLGFELKEGMEVKITGYSEVYAPYGRLSLIAEYIAPVGEGALKLAFEQLKKQLYEAGYFNPDRKQKLPSYVQTVGLITAEGSAAEKDFLTHLGQHGIKIYFHDSRMEGLNAVEHVVKAIRWFNEHAADIDVLVITRGGGSLESLQAFNTIEVAKAIYSSKIPVLTAIGHEKDITIADYVADVRASVPTHAGKILGDPWADATDNINNIERNVLMVFKAKLRAYHTTLNTFQKDFAGLFQYELSAYKKDIDRLSESLAQCQTAFQTMLRNYYETLDDYQSFFVGSFQQQLSNYGKDINWHNDTLTRCFKEMLRKIKHIDQQFTFNFERFHSRQKRLTGILADYEKQIQNQANSWYKSMSRRLIEQENLLRMSDPELKLKQGYSIVKNSAGSVIKVSTDVARGDIIAVQLYRGKLTSKVEGTE